MFFYDRPANEYTYHLMVSNQTQTQILYLHVKVLQVLNKILVMYSLTAFSRLCKFEG